MQMENNRRKKRNQLNLKLKLKKNQNIKENKINSYKNNFKIKNCRKLCPRSFQKSKQNTSEVSLSTNQLDLDKKYFQK